MTPLNCLSSKTPCLMQESRSVSSVSRVITTFDKIRYNFNRQSEQNFNDIDTIRFSNHDFSKWVGCWWGEVVLYDFGRVYYVHPCNTGSRSHDESTIYFQLLEEVGLDACVRYGGYSV